ncbi:MAG: hypothetical protein D6679_09450 [Candidatus Hydrogenedentota bacterium]|nr:MAG: hypothetical protein D6679_09450 [Candidatus Hydrogenedentota bacterium]
MPFSVQGKPSFQVLRSQKTTFTDLFFSSFSVTSPCALCSLWFPCVRLAGVQFNVWNSALNIGKRKMNTGKRETRNDKSPPRSVFYVSAAILFLTGFSL